LANDAIAIVFLYIYTIQCSVDGRSSGSVRRAIDTEGMKAVTDYRYVYYI